MGNIIAQSLEGNIKHTFNLLDQFLEVCPENIWGKKFGGWPVWQQVYHALSALDFFTRPQDAPEGPKPFGKEEANLSGIATSTANKAKLKTYAVEMQAQTHAYIAGLDDADLARNNEGLATRMGRSITHASTLTLIAAHTLYHLGSCDAALREHGLPVVF